MAKQDTSDFHKISENENVEVYQSMQRYKTKETVTESGATLAAPIKYGPQTFKTLDSSTLSSALDQFKGYDVVSVQVSKDAGIVVKVQRAKGDTYEVVEPGVTRLQPKGGDAK